MYLPTTPAELSSLGWDQLDVILVSGDSYIDSPYIGTAVIGKLLVEHGYRVGVIAQPDVNSEQDITRLGEPRLFWGVTAGSIDSMVANYTPLKKKRRQDDYTPGGHNDRRPNRATIAYTNLIRRYFKDTQPIVLGGIEASLRRIAHYDFWSNKIRRSILFDSKADYLLYGMAEKAVLELAAGFKSGQDVQQLRGLCYITSEPVQSYSELPSFEHVQKDKHAFIDMFHAFYQNNDPLIAKGLIQRHGDRYLVQNPPQPYLSQTELDEIYALPYERSQHPYYESQGSVRALDTIKYSISTHRGCYGECNFCAIAVHEGRTVRWRSQASILSEARKLTKQPGFKGYIQDVGGPTANMYGFECDKKLSSGVCSKKHCLYPDTCSLLQVDHQPQIDLLRAIRELPGVKKAFIASGIRYDMLMGDEVCGNTYLQELAAHHVSGQLKVAPEHTEPQVLAYMGKPGTKTLLEFKEAFDQASLQSGKRQFLTYYFIAAHPGSREQDMHALKRFVSRKLKMNPEQVQIFTPTPSTYSTLMYYTELDPFTRRPLYVEKEPAKVNRQKQIVVTKGQPHE